MGMTEHEAIEILKPMVRTDSFDETFAEIQRDCALTMAIKALEEIDLYKQGGLCLIPSETFKNQCDRLDELEPLRNPLKVDEFLLHNGKTGYQCKNCGSELAVDVFNGEYCHWCGQKLKWRNEDAE